MGIAGRGYWPGANALQAAPLKHRATGREQMTGDVVQFHTSLLRKIYARCRGLRILALVAMTATNHFGDTMPDQYPLTPKAVNAIVVLTFAIISILLARAPKLSEAWASLDGNTKRYAFLGMYLVAAISVMAIQCGGSGQACIQNNLWQAVNVGITAWLSSQGAFLFFGKKPSGGEKSQ